MLAFGDALQHGHCSQVPPEILVCGGTGREVPEGATQVAHDGQRGGAELGDQEGNALLLP